MVSFATYTGIRRLKQKFNSKTEASEAVPRFRAEFVVQAIRTLWRFQHAQPASQATIDGPGCFASL
jgi:hypothetical protein